MHPIAILNMDWSLASRAAWRGEAKEVTDTCVTEDQISGRWAIKVESSFGCTIAGVALRVIHKIAIDDPSEKCASTKGTPRTARGFTDGGQARNAHVGAMGAGQSDRGVGGII